MTLIAFVVGCIMMAIAWPKAAKLVIILIVAYVTLSLTVRDDAPMTTTTEQLQ